MKSFVRLRCLMENDRSEMVRFYAVLAYGNVFERLEEQKVDATYFKEELRAVMKKDESAA